MSDWFEGVELSKRAKCIEATDKAIMAFVPEYNGNKPFWVPQSQVHDDSEIWKPGQVGRFVVSVWWAQKHNFV